VNEYAELMLAIEMGLLDEGDLTDDQIAILEAGN
jgi:hypothetical protein